MILLLSVMDLSMKSIRPVVESQLIYRQIHTKMSSPLAVRHADPLTSRKISASSMLVPKVIRMGITQNAVNSAIRTTLGVKCCN